MPKVLELKPLKKKHLKLVMVESEFPVDWWFEAPKKVKEDLVWNLHLISKEYLDVVENLIDKYKPNFGAEETPTNWYESPNKVDPLEKLFKLKGIPFLYVDIDDNARDYLSAALEEHRIAIKKLEKHIREEITTKGKIPEDDEWFQKLIIWKEYLEQDYTKQEDDVRFNIREAWMMMNIINLAKEVEGTKLKGLFICDLRHFNGIEKLCTDLGIDLEKIKIKRTIKTEEIEELEKDVEIAIKNQNS
ncbi:MAG: hypothetical protein ACFFAS_05035 [Promethearchaeota archaeon]